MKISQTSGVKPTQTTEARPGRSDQKRGTAGASGSGQTRREDSVTLTDAAKQLNELAAGAQKGGPLNQEKVDRIRGALSRGEYRVNPQRVAARLFSQEVK